jgi:hypothetical protein
MVVHIVSFKYRAEIDAAARQDHRSKLSALANIDGILDLKVGEDFVPSPSSAATSARRLSPSISTHRGGVSGAFCSYCHLFVAVPAMSYGGFRKRFPTPPIS